MSLDELSDPLPKSRAEGMRSGERQLGGVAV